MFKKFFEKIAPLFGGHAEIKVKQSLIASVIRACKYCGVSGVDGFGKEVGIRCPSCGMKRPKAESLGTIWQKFG